MAENTQAKENPCFQNQSAVPLQKTSPAYLVNIGNTHGTPISAIGELIDNAYDPDVDAKRILLEHKVIRNEPCLIFRDDGNGANRNTLENMLSFGYSGKSDVGEHKAIGRFGSGFKSGSMALGKDAIVFSRTAGTATDPSTMSVGLLSLTYNIVTKQHAIHIPMVTFSANGKFIDKERDHASLEAIYSYSLFRNMKELMDELAYCPGIDGGIKEKSGTVIYIWNLNTEKIGLEFRPNADPPDIEWSQRPITSPVVMGSLRNYGAIMFKIPRIKIHILGKLVRAKLVEKNLLCSFTDTYTPRNGKAPVKLTMGIAPEKADTDHGLLLYNRNRLIEAYIALRMKAPYDRTDIVIVAEVDHLDPLQNKQGFSKDVHYNNFINSVKEKYKHYVDKVLPGLDRENGPTWVQCMSPKCCKWRCLPPGERRPITEEQWFCSMNKDTMYNDCSKPQGPLDNDEPPRKVHKKRQKNGPRVLNATQVMAHHLPEEIARLISPLTTPEKVGPNDSAAGSPTPRSPKTPAKRIRSDIRRFVVNTTMTEPAQEPPSVPVEEAPMVVEEQTSDPAVPSQHVESDTERFERKRNERRAKHAQTELWLKYLAATCYGSLPDTVQTVVDELHFNRTQQQLPNVMVKCTKCDLWRLSPETLTEGAKKNWKCAFGNLQCQEKPEPADIITISSDEEDQVGTSKDTLVRHQTRMIQEITMSLIEVLGMSKPVESEAGEGEKRAEGGASSPGISLDGGAGGGGADVSIDMLELQTENHCLNDEIQRLRNANQKLAEDKKKLEDDRINTLNIAQKFWIEKLNCPMKFAQNSLAKVATDLIRLIRTEKDVPFSSETPIM